MKFDGGYVKFVSLHGALFHGTFFLSSFSRELSGFHLFSFIFSLSSFTLNNIWDVQAALLEAVLHRDAVVAVVVPLADAIE